MKMPEDMIIVSINGTPLENPIIARNTLFTPVPGAIGYTIYGPDVTLCVPATVESTEALNRLWRVYNGDDRLDAESFMALFGYIDRLIRQDRFRLLMRLRKQRKARWN